jgi:acetoacetyl-CoA synthetase
MSHFRRRINENCHQNLQDTAELHRFSVQHPHDFWCQLYTHLALVPPLPPGTTRAYDDSLPLRANPPWFPALRINYAENALGLGGAVDDDAVALIGVREDTDLDGADAESESVTWRPARSGAAAGCDGATAWRRWSARRSSPSCCSTPPPVWGPCSRA